MAHLNVEIKARCSDPARIREVLRAHGAEFRGLDHQIDTYFRVPNGRLKLREGNIEYALIHYRRPDSPDPKPSSVSIYRPLPDPALKEVLTAALEVLVVVEKEREIYFIDNVKFHIDTVKGLGHFVEIEAIDPDGTVGADRLDAQCRFYMAQFGIRDADLIDRSYSDMLCSEVQDAH